MNNTNVFILWDASHLWGIMALRAMRAFGLQCRLVKSTDIAHGALIGKPNKNAVLLAPGGSARLKALALGYNGREALREWVYSGGTYIGFCGGAGLALSQKNPDEGLGICPWTRAGYSRRLYHMLSGHVLATDHARNILRLPVWWPGRFAPEPNAGPHVLAQYFAPSDDLWVSDLPLARIPAHILKMWEMTRGIASGMDFPAGQPLVVWGPYGKGKYVLSYAHLETPQSGEANALLASLLRDFCGLEPQGASVPAWQTDSLPGEAGCADSSLHEALRPILESLLRLMRLAVDLRLFFHRTPWLLGWRAGEPGMACNNLLAALHYMTEIKESQAAVDLWRQQGNDFIAGISLFLEKAEAFFWESRLEKTLASALEMRHSAGAPHNSHSELFGHPMLGGGFVEKLLRMVEEMIYLSDT